MKTIMLNANLACLKTHLVRNENSAFIYSPSCSSNPLGMREKSHFEECFCAALSVLLKAVQV